jgi:formylmethanofuran dehydrogenase subunit E
MRCRDCGEEIENNDVVYVQGEVFCSWCADYDHTIDEPED